MAKFITAFVLGVGNLRSATGLHVPGIGSPLEHHARIQTRDLSRLSSTIKDKL